MRILLAPSKTLDMTSPLPFVAPATKPLFAREAKEIKRTIATLSQNDIEKTMRLSPALAAKVWQLYHDTSPPEKQALWAYVGDVYRGVHAATLEKAAADWAQEHVRISSGLFGLLRPYDLLYPYRLEMQTKISIGKARTLYDYWGDTLATSLMENDEQTVVVLSSEEYAKAVTRHLPKTIRLVTPRFFDHKPNGVVGQVPIYSKQMRGVMARWMIDTRCDAPEKLAAFTSQGYYYDAKRSTPGSPAFTRLVMRPLDLPLKSTLSSNVIDVQVEK